MKLFGGIYLTLFLIQLSVQQSGSNNFRWGVFRRNVGGGDSNDWSSGSVVESDIPKRNSLRQKQIFQTSVKFVLRCPKGNVEKEEQVSIAAGRSIPSKLQRVMEPTAGFITVVYRDSRRGVLTRIEKIPLPEHLPKETIPAGGLVVNRAELPWEPSINPLDVVEPEEVVNDAKPWNIENQNDDESPRSSPTRVAPEGSYRRPSQIQKSEASSFLLPEKLRRPQTVYLDNTSAPLRPKSAVY